MKKNYPIKVAPSILSGDFGYLDREAKKIADAGADSVHIDIMDGNFVPNLTLGVRAVAAINRATDIFLDVHLMIYHPFDFIEQFVEAGADQITFHFEATEDVDETLEYIRRCNIRAGLAFCPETSVSMIPKFLDKCDQILLMTVHPGFGGQEFIPDVLEKIMLTRGFCDRLHIRENGKIDETDTLPPFDIQVDGGINNETAKLCVDAGANVLVSGNYLFKLPDMKEGIRKLHEITP